MNTTFIRLYKFHTCLWNRFDKYYTNQTKRNEAVENIMQEINEKWNIKIAKRDVLKKIYFIRFLFLQLLKDYKVNITVDNPNIPWYYEDILFLKGHAGPHSEFKCVECNKVLRTHQAYLDHIFNHDGIPRYICNKCGREFGKAVSLKVHSKSHLDIKDRPHECPLCHKKFALKVNFRVHMRRHDVDKPYQCNDCPKSFPTKPELRNHSRKHTGEKPFVCDVCGKSFKFHPHFYRHRSRHLNGAIFKCSLCPKSFYAHDNLRSHLVAHSTIRDNICNKCGKGFKDMKTLRQHQLIHSEQKKYVCKICGRAFAQSAGRHSHMKTHEVSKEKKKAN